MVLCTHGSEGSVARVGDEILRIPVVKADKVVDATGAGDSYRAGYYAALYRGHPVHEALVIGSAVASFVVEATGALTNIPAWDDVMARAEPYLEGI
jgi:sugar/nucleoside kinase (ribokinase family)